MNTHTPLRIPDHLSRADIGAYMRDLRLHYTLSEQDVSQRLHIRVKYVMAIEQADFEAMPGRAYARGYVHTYAEFLGLDADQVVERCFGVEPSATPVLPPRAPVKPPSRTLHWAIPLAVIIAIAAFFALQHRPDTLREATPDTAQVDAVPEEYLAGLRTQFMPAPDSYGCFAEESLLGCVRSGPLAALITPRPLPDMAPVAAPSPPESQEEQPPVDTP